MRDIARPCSAKIKPCLPGRRWHRRRRSKLRSVLHERRRGTGRKRREDWNDCNQRDAWARQWPRPDPDHGCKTMTRDDAPTAYRHTPPPTPQNSPADRGRTAAAISLVQGRLRNCLGVMVLPHRVFCLKNMLKFNRSGPKGPVSLTVRSPGYSLVTHLPLVKLPRSFAISRQTGRSSPLLAKRNFSGAGNLANPVAPATSDLTLRLNFSFGAAFAAAARGCRRSR